MFDKDRIYVPILFTCCLLSRLATSIYYIEDIDSLRFALSLYEYDIANLQPHFPGYPVFSLFAKSFYAVSGSMAFSFSLIGGLSLFFLIYFALKIQEIKINSNEGSFLVFIIFFNPLIWMMSNRYMPDLMGFAVVVAIFYFLLTIGKNDHYAPMGFFLIGLLAGVRLSYLPIVLYPFIKQLFSNKHKIKLFLCASLGVSIWLVPMVLITGLDTLVASASAHTYGHFMDFGGTIFTESNWYYRLINIFQSIWADGLGGYWVGRSWQTAFYSLFLSGLISIGLFVVIKNWRFERMLRVIAKSSLVYILWIFVSQNVIYKSRHILPILIVVFMIISISFELALNKRSKSLNVILLIFSLFLVQITGKLVLQHTQPSAIAQLKENMSNSNYDTILSTPLINFYMRVNKVEASYVNVENSKDIKQFLNSKSQDSKAIMIGNFKDLLKNNYSFNPLATYYHNPYVNRMWARLETYNVVRKKLN